MRFLGDLLKDKALLFLTRLGSSEDQGYSFLFLYFFVNRVPITMHK